jgi:hypothetical protein
MLVPRIASPLGSHSQTNANIFLYPHNNAQEFQVFIYKIRLLFFNVEANGILRSDWVIVWSESCDDAG